MKYHSLFKLTALSLGFFLLVSCHRNQIKTTDIPYTPSLWTQHQTWSFNGKMALNDGNTSGSGRITWAVDGNMTKAQFKAPLGQGSWKITETPSNATLESTRNGKSTADNASSLISNELGWEFPWNSLHFWARGYRTNQALEPHLTLPTSITDNGWSITYQKWMNTPLGLLPKKIKATKDNYSVKLIIYNWKLN